VFTTEEANSQILKRKRKARNIFDKVNNFNCFHIFLITYCYLVIVKIYRTSHHCWYQRGFCCFQVGVLPMDDSKVIMKGRLGPGMMITADLQSGQVCAQLSILLFIVIIFSCMVYCEETISMCQIAIVSG